MPKNLANVKKGAQNKKARKRQLETKTKEKNVEGTISTWVLIFGFELIFV